MYTQYIINKTDGITVVGMFNCTQWRGPKFEPICC